MAWTYSEDPTTSPLDAIRFEIGDTIEEDPLLLDAEVLFCITQEDGHYASAARACEAIAAKFAREANRRIGPTAIDARQKAEAYARRAQELRTKALIKGKPYAGGLSHAEKQVDRTDNDLVQPKFKKGMMNA